MTWEAIIVAVSLVGMHAAWGVAYWCRRRLSEAHETYRDKLWDAEQQRDQARVQRDEAIARAEKAERQFALAEARDAELDRLAEERTADLLKDRARWQQSADALRRLVESQEQEQNKLTSERSAAEKERDAAIKRAKQAERAVGRLRALRTRIAEVLADHDHPGTVEVVVNTMSKGAGDAS